MIRISLPWMIDVVSSVDGLSHVKEDMPIGEAWVYVYTAHNKLNALLEQSLYSGSIVSARQSAELLRSALAEMLSRAFDSSVLNVDAWNLHIRQNEFRTILVAELATLPAYFILPKAPYSTETLLNSGELLMPAEMSTKVPEAVFDMREAGHCLAFEVGTACAFHAFRALEAVVRRYFSEVCKAQAAPRQRNLGVYIKALEKSGANSKVISTLAQLKDLHRNPVAHPEAVITTEEAITIVGLVRSAVATMLQELPMALPTTLSAAPAI